MGQYTIKMPDIGEGIAEVELVEWRVNPGDEVVEDQVLADVMTDKATVEIPSPVAGTVVELGGNPGELMAVGAELIRLQVSGEGNAKEKVRQVTVADLAPALSAPAKAKPEVPASAASSSPTVLQSSPSERGFQLPGVPQTPMRALGYKPMASPAVRRRAWESGIELQFVHGSGPAGRITDSDLDIYIASRGQPRTTGESSRYAERHGETAHAVIGLRRKIAQKMQEAKRRIPHFSYVEEIDVTDLEALRAKLNELYGADRGKLTLLPLLARALVLALRDFPQMNARFDDDAGVVTRHDPVHLGIATQTDAGLVVAVVRHAESKDPWSTAREIARLAESARAGKAGRDELAGSTITISSLGPLGGIVTTPVINYPEVAIIGVNRIVERPVFRHGEVVARKLMNLSSSFDHRVIDGVEAAEFIQAVRALMQTPALLFVD